MTRGVLAKENGNDSEAIDVVLSELHAASYASTHAQRQVDQLQADLMESDEIREKLGHLLSRRRHFRRYPGDEGASLKSGNRWTAEEVAILAAHNGRPREAVIALAQAGYSRSVSAVATMMQKLRDRGQIEQTHQSRAYGVLSAKIEAALERRGAMTRDELCRALGQDRRTVAGVLNRLRDTGRVHISEWRRHAPGQREYPRPVYAAGPGVDAKRPPKVERKEANRRYREIRGVGVHSVFDLGRIVARIVREESKA